MDEASDAPYGPLSWQDTNRPKKGSRDRLPGSPETPDVLTARYSEWRWDLAWHHVPQALTYRLTKRSEEALCCGWVDSLVRRLDDDLFARKFTPRKATSAWSTRNRRRYTNLQSRGLLAPPGLERAPTDKSGDAPRPSVIELHSYNRGRLSCGSKIMAILRPVGTFVST